MGFTVDCNTLSSLIDQYLQGTISLKDQAVLDEWYSSFDRTPDLYSPEISNPSVAFAALKKQMGLQNTVLAERQSATT